MLASTLKTIAPKTLALRTLLLLGLTIAAWCVDSPTADAQFGGLQIQIGRGGYGGYYGSGYSLSIPFGVGPSIPPTSRAYMGPGYSTGYRGYYGYSAIPGPGDYGVTPFGYPSPTYSNPNYRTYDYNGSGPYSGDGVLSYQQRLDLYRLQEREAQSRLYSQQVSPYSQQVSPYPSQQSYRAQPRSQQGMDDLRPGMVLPDGSTVLSVDPPGPTNSGTTNAQPTPAPANPIPSTPDGSRKSNRASF